METEHNECPCCHQDWVADTDRNCPTCDLPVSEHVSVEVLCRRVREAQQRESALIVEVHEQARLLGISAERECDLRGKLDAERALADRLAEAAKAVIDQWETPNWKLTEPTATYMNKLMNTLAEWKEARSE